MRYGDDIIHAEHRMGGIERGGCRHRRREK